MVDLHLHTNHSDGYFGPEQLVIKAAEKKIKVIAITDHDSISAYDAASVEAAKYNIELISGVELSSEIAGREIHILGYFIDTKNVELNEYLKFFRTERVRRAEKIVKKLNLLGVDISTEDVFRIAKDSAVGRPHIAQVLIEKNIVPSYVEAFGKYLGNHASAYVKKVYISPASAYKIINDAGGLAFLAHPGNIVDRVLIELIESGLDGIEIIHPSHSEFQTKNFRKIASEYFLLTSGGSDFHGGRRNDEYNLGNYSIPSKFIDEMKKRLISTKI